MCGRYNVVADPLAALLMALVGAPLRESRYNVAPTEDVPVLRAATDPTDPAPPCELVSMRWWLVPSWSSGPSQKYAMFNARSESVLRSRAYREPFRRRRCLLPASGFVEWQKTASGKQPYQVRPAAADGLLMAGVWERWRGPDGTCIDSCSILTTAAHPKIAFLHDRMPVLLGRHEVAGWLAPEQDDETLMAFCTPALPVSMVIEPLSTAINNARSKSSAGAEPIGPGEHLDADERRH
jgi:putative SOS response-associated peptidase YedK